MPIPSSPHPPAPLKNRRRWLNVIALGALALIIAVGLLVHGWRAPPPAPVVNHSYAEALEQAHNGKPGAARVLYQQLSRTDLSDIRRSGLLTELANYPSPQALKILDGDLKRPAPLVQQTAIDTVAALVPDAQRSVLIGPLLDDPDQSVRFCAVRALLGLTPDDLGLYYASVQDAAEQYQNTLASQPPNGESQLELAKLFVNTGAFEKAFDALDLALKLEPNNLQAAVAQVQLLDQRGQTDRSRQQLAQLLEKHPQSALLQYELGKWLLRHQQNEYALLAMAKAVELEPENTVYRYDLAAALHDLHQLEPAQRQLEDILQRQPANRRARTLLIRYWQENGQLQKVQVLLAELEQLNPDDPALQQGL
ncbi:tetratricopeptide repeat protein [Pseudomonas abietaniphila]|uniref:Tfp pilus assembly protein PilF n=1 Tax=Pseudomonas abietaniphila TaxID=89065 RepID=A0A1G7U3G9_9PSED|nr:tetratricopeptide repeat protein [Pseudomonas abietaniphila]SDG41987.1 Tfp pilus assembly protein PilF [Pseudomonas abietaniphila]